MSLFRVAALSATVHGGRGQSREAGLGRLRRRRLMPQALVCGHAHCEDRSAFLTVSSCFRCLISSSAMVFLSSLTEASKRLGE